MPTLDRTTWFIFADGAKARLFESGGATEGWALAKEWRSEEARVSDKDLGKDRPTRGRTIGSGQRYAVSEKSAHDQAEDAFIMELAGFLNDAADQDRFDQVVLAAPPRALGLLRRRLRPESTERCIAMWDKDLTNMPETELLSYCRESLRRW